jgi:hypothetical protein
MGTEQSWKPQGLGKYVATLVETPLIKAGFLKYPYIEASMRLEWCPEGDPTRLAFYRIVDVPRNLEPRGRCVKGERITSREKQELLLRNSGLGHDIRPDPMQDNIVLRLPDIEDFLSDQVQQVQQTKRYLGSFDQELAAELEILKRLDKLGKDEVARRLPSEDELPKFRIPKGNQYQPIDGMPTDGDYFVTPVLIRDYLEGESLREWCNRQKQPFKGCHLETWFDFASKILFHLHRVHLAGAQHGYVCPENIIIKNAEGDPPKLALPRLINFERDIPDPTLRIREEDKFTQDEKSKLCWRRPYDCPEKLAYYTDNPEALEGYDPLVLGDVFSLGQTLLFLASGENISPFVGEKPWGARPWNRVTRDVTWSNIEMKRKIYKILSKLPKPKLPNTQERIRRFEDLVAITEVIFACLRLEKPRFFNIRSILEVLQHFDYRSTPASSLPSTAPPDADYANVKSARDALDTALEKAPNALLGTLYRDRLRRMTLPLDETSQFRYTVGKGREEIIDALVLTLMNLQPRHKSGSRQKARCVALVTPAFFFPENCGAAGRVWSAITVAAARGASIRLLYLLNESRMNSPRVVHVLAHQKEELERHDLPQGVLKNVEIGWLPLPQPQYKNLLRRQQTFLHLIPAHPSPPQPVLLKPDYASDLGRIIALRAFPLEDDESEEWCGVFEEYWKLRNDLSKYPHKD